MATCEVAICSNKPRASNADNSRSRGWWSREVYHLEHTATRKTLCGRERDGWLTIGFIDKLDGNCCKKCAVKSVLPPPHDTAAKLQTGEE